MGHSREPAMNDSTPYDDWLSPSLDVAALRRRYQEAGGVVAIDDVIRAEIAERIHRSLAIEIPDDWWTVITATADGSARLRDTAENAAAIDAHRSALRELRAARRRSGGIRVPPFTFKRMFDDHYPTCVCGVCAFRGFSTSPPLLAFVERFFGAPYRPREIFASKYTAGDHLDVHNDSLQGREIAFVWNLSKDWEPHDGGVLVLSDGPAERTFLPGFNRLVMFGVGDGGRDHRVTEVAATTTKKRIAIAGWFG